MRVSPHTAQAAQTPRGRTRCDRLSYPSQLHDTHLEPPRGFAPIAGAPARTMPAVICFPARGRFAKLSRDERPGGSLPAFAWDDVAIWLRSRRSPKAQSLSSPLQRGLRFLRPPLPAGPSAHLAVRFPSFDKLRMQEGDLRAYHVPCKYPRGLGSASPPGVHRLR